MKNKLQWNFYCHILLKYLVCKMNGVLAMSPIGDKQFWFVLKLDDFIFFH